MTNILSQYATSYLEHTIVPLALVAVGLSESTPLEVFLNLSLADWSDRNIFDDRNFRARELCLERPIFSVALTVRHIAQNQHADRICKKLIDVMMCDATELISSSDLFSDSCLIGVDNRQEKVRCLKAEKKWQRWEETDQKINTRIDDLLSELAELIWREDTVS